MINQNILKFIIFFLITVSYDKIYSMLSQQEKTERIKFWQKSATELEKIINKMEARENLTEREKGELSRKKNALKRLRRAMKGTEKAKPF